MRDLLEHPWVKVLLIATAVAMCTFALRETAWITQPIIAAFGDVLLPVVIGFALAYVLTPIVDAISRQGGVRRFVAASMLFGVVGLAMVLLVVLVVPAVMHEGAMLTQRVFQGEASTEQKHSGRTLLAEPFSMQVRDQGLLTAGLQRLEDWQTRLKIHARLAFDDADLAFLGVCFEHTRELRDWQERLMAAARQGATLESWPAAPSAVSDAVTPPQAHEWSWPSPSPDAISEASSKLPLESRTPWLNLMRKGDAALSASVAQLQSALEAARGNGQEPLAVEIRTAFKNGVAIEDRSEIQAFADTLEQADQYGQAQAHQLLHAMHGDSPLGSKTLAGLVSQVDATVRNSIAHPDFVGDWTKDGVKDLWSWLGYVFDLFLVPIYAFFLVLAMPSIRLGVHRYIPRRRRDQILRIIRDIEQVVAAFFRGRLIICTVCALVAWLGFSAISVFSAVNMPYAALFGIGIGFATTVPLSGLLFLIPAMVLTMIQPGAMLVHAVMVLSVYILVQGVEAVLIPLIMGHEVELHPVMLIVALLLCGKLLGIIGLVLAVPIAATCRILAREFLWPRLREWADRPAPHDEPPPLTPTPDAGIPTSSP
jgi:predicted PurR-regulated permease PerM